MKRAGHYRNWQGNFSVILAKEDLWYRVDRVFSAVMTIRKFDLSCASDRKSTRSLIDTMTSGFPASETARFPENKFYICESSSTWASKFTKLRSSLNELGKIAMVREVYAKDLEFLQDLLEDFLAVLKIRNSVIGRAQFEKMNEVTWEEPDDSS